MSLPAWVDKVDSDLAERLEEQGGYQGDSVHIAWLRQALTIAWESLSEIDPPLNSSEHGCWKIAREAMRRIEEMGK